MIKPALLCAFATTLVAAGLSGAAGATAAPATGPTSNVIVVLRDQHADIPATPAQIGRRKAVLGSDQAAVSGRLARLGARTTHTYDAVNAVAVTVPSSAVAALSADPAVARVVPDLVWHAPAAAADPATHGGAAAAATAPAGACPTDPSKPLLEPEALSLTHTDSDAAKTPTARSLGFDGAGVKVAFIADGVDIDQPDYIRADGSHVFTDYQDFSGDGTASSTSGAEALGDASSIAAQGRVSYDLADFVNPAHPLPRGCTIRVEGMAPGASLVGLKIFANALLTAPTSTIIQAVDYAVSVDHVDVINESFGANPYPDDATDPISIFNRDAVDAGVTVVASSGDAGFGNTMGTAATDPWVIGVGATTQFQSYLQTARAGVQLGNGRVASDQPSSLSSSGIAQTDRTIDLMAPGDLGWATCSDRLLPDGSPQYVDCTNYAGQLSNLQLFGGTSESSPLAAGAAALVIQAYRKTHHGASPTPQQVRLALDDGADDLGLPAEDQGSGLLDTYRSVQLAERLGAAHAPDAQGLVLDQPALSATTTPGASVTQNAFVTNVGSGTQRVTATTRRIDTVSARDAQTLDLSATNPTRTFVDTTGITRSYVRATFTVAPGTDLLVASWAIGQAGKNVRMSLFDPQGTFSAYTLPQGATVGFGEVELRRPAAGTWSAVIYTSAGSGYTGPVDYRATSYHASTAGTVSPASFTLAPGARQRLTITTPAPTAGAAASAVVLTGNFGQTTTLPVVLDAVQPVSAGTPATFSGSFADANGRDFSPGESDTYRFAVPAGARDLDVDLAVAGGPHASPVIAHLSDPSGEPVATVSNQHQDGTTTVTDPGLQIQHAAPAAGVWQLTLELVNPVSGKRLPRPYSGTVSLDGAQVTSTGVPTGRATVSRTAGTRATVTVTNTGPAPLTYFLDPRATSTTTYPLVAAQDATADPFTAQVALPLPSEQVPAWIVPTESTRLTVGSSASEPTTFDVMPLDSPTAVNAPNNPDTEATVAGNGASAVLTGSPIASVLWAAFPSVIGPLPAAGAPAGTVSMQASVDTLTFADDVNSSTGDPLLGTVRAHSSAGRPVTVLPGRSATISVRITPTGAVGSRGRGTLFLDVLTPGGAAGNAGYADAVSAIPYAYVVAG